MAAAGEPREGVGQMDLPENQGSKLFQDSVHGVMQFHRLLVNFIDTREFQRLRNIKQLSTTYLVFPAAAHNRFEHCLGVCWLAGELLDELKNNSPKEWKTIFPNDKEGKRIKLAVQIAGLLHDLGHGPFSHTWEVFIRASGGNWDHEKTSCDLIDLMLWKDGTKEDNNLTSLGKLFKDEFKDVEKNVNLIKNLIIGGPVPQDNTAFLFEIVANKSNDIDVDKWDYFLRDSQHLKIGVSFDYRRLMSLCQIQIKKGDGVSHIAYRDVERYSIEGMFRTRADLHVRAYQHRVSKCLEAMLIDAFKEADKNEFKIRNKPLSRVHEDPAAFSTLTDSIQETLQNSEDPKLDSTKKLLDRISTRDLYETVAELPVERSQTEEERKNNVTPSGISQQKLNELEHTLNHKFSIMQVCVNQGKYYNPIERVNFYPKQGRSIIERSVPAIGMNLPFYKLYVFKRVKEQHDIEDVKEKVEFFLKNEEPNA